MTSTTVDNGKGKPNIMDYLFGKEDGLNKKAVGVLVRPGVKIKTAKIFAGIHYGGFI